MPASVNILLQITKTIYRNIPESVKSQFLLITEIIDKNRLKPYSMEMVINQETYTDQAQFVPAPDFNYSSADGSPENSFKDDAEKANFEIAIAVGSHFLIDELIPESKYIEGMTQTAESRAELERTMAGFIERVMYADKTKSRTRKNLEDDQKYWHKTLNILKH